MEIFLCETQPRRAIIPANQNAEIDALRDFRLLWLETFFVVADMGSFTEAGKTLGLSQSNVSRQIKDLETWLGKKLIIRAKPIKLTPAGEDFIGTAFHLLDALGDARAPRKALPTDAGYIPICQRHVEYDDSEIDPSLPKEIRQRLAARFW